MTVSERDKAEAFTWAISGTRFTSEVSRLGMYFLRSLVSPEHTASPEDLSATATRVILLAKDFAESVSEELYDYADLDDLNRHGGIGHLISMKSSAVSPSLARLVEVIYESSGYDLIDLSAILTQIDEAVRQKALSATLVEHALSVQAWKHVVAVIGDLQSEEFENPPVEIVLEMVLSSIRDEKERQAILLR